LDQPSVVSQLRAADAKNPALEGYIYEAMRKRYSRSMSLVLMFFLNLM
jgi:hypothetical protein